MKHASARPWILLTVVVWTFSAPARAAGGQAEPEHRVGPADGPARSCGFRSIGRGHGRRSNQITGSRWGVSCHWIADNHPLDTEQQLEQLASLGAKWGLLVPNWDLIETTRGQYNWNSTAHRLDDAVNGLFKRKISPIIQIYGGNHLYMPLAPPGTPPGIEIPALTSNPEAREAWFAWIDAMARRYSGRVKVWEVWNEPNTEWFWKPRPDAAAYGQMVKDVAAILRRVDPAAVILAGSTALTPLDFLNGFLESNAATCFNAWSVHPYAAVPEETDAAIRRLREVLSSRGKPGAIWQTECGLPSKPDTGGWGYGGPWDETRQAKWLLRRFLCDASLGMKVSIYFILNDYPALLEAGPSQGRMGTNRKGLHRTGSWRRKPAAYAFSHLASLIDDRFELTPVQVDFTVSDAGPFTRAGRDSIRTCTFIDRQTGSPLIAWWLAVPLQSGVSAGKVKVTLAEGVVEDPVLVDLLDGRVYTVPTPGPVPTSATFKGLPLADSPMMLCRGQSLPPIDTENE
jgi:polysaccharide biosynthesis protein PslG